MSLKKKKRRSVWDYLAIVILIYIVVSRGPTWLEQWQMQKQPFSSEEMSVFDLQQNKVAFPSGKGPWIVVFWATWCGPCTVELNRLKEAAEDGSIDPKRVLAVSVHEPYEDVRRAIEERQYPFQIFIDREGQTADQFNVQVTPTVVLIDADQKINWITSGVSPTLIWRSKRHLAGAVSGDTSSP